MGTKENKGKEHMAFVRGKSLPISTKMSVEICNFIRGKLLNKAYDLLGRIGNKEIALPLRRFNRDIAHKPGRVAAGRYPQKAIDYFLRLLKSVRTNAENLGLNGDNLVIERAIANQGEHRWHHGRIRGIRMKRTHVEIGVKEIEEKKK